MSSPCGHGAAGCGFSLRRWPRLFRSCCASNVESDLTLVEMVHAHERLTLIILAREATWHLDYKTCLVELVTASVKGRRVEVISEAVGATMNRSGAVC